MKLLLWACILCVAFTKKRFFHVPEKFLTSGEKDYSGNHYPRNPSLNIPYPMSDIDFASFHPSENKVPHYPGNPDPDTGVPSFPSTLTSPEALFNHTPNFPITAGSIPSPPPQEFPHFVPNSQRSEGPFSSLNAPLSTAADPHVDTSTTPLPHPETVTVEPGPIEPDDAEPIASVPQPSTSPD